MAPTISNHWTTDPAYIDLLNYLIRKTENVELPMRIKRMAIEFKEKSGAAQTVGCLRTRIESVRTRIHDFEHIDMNTKVKVLFALSASVDANFLKRMKKEAIVEVDDKKRIMHYKASDGSLELTGDHSHSAKQRTASFESKQCIRSLIIDYFENKINSNAVPKNEEEKEMGNFIEFITENCVNVDTPLSITQLAKDFKNHFGISLPVGTIRSRIQSYRREIQRIEFLDTPTKVKQLFCLSATVDSEYLEELQKNALVEVDESNRITYYKSNDGSLELRGDHSLSVKVRTGKLESKGSLRSWINNYFENKNDVDAIPQNEEEKEMGNLIEFITEKCVNLETPINVLQLTKDFKNHFGISVPLATIRSRIRAYCREIQETESLDTHTKVKQLFGLSIKLDSDCLKELRKDALVEVDHENRIIKYVSNDNSLTLRGSHWGSKTTKPRRVRKRNKNNAAAMSDNSEEVRDHDGLDDSCDEYSSEEFDSEFNSSEDNDYLNEPSNEANDFDNDTSIRDRSPTEMSIDNHFVFDPPSEIGENLTFKTKSERLSKRRHSDSNFSNNLSNSSGSGTSTSINSILSKHAKQKKIGGSIQEDLNVIERGDDIQQIQKTSDDLQAIDEHNQIEEVPIKVEQGEPVEVKPKTSHNSKIKFYEAMKSLIVCVDNPSLSWIQSKIHQIIQKLGGSDEVILNNEVVLIIQLLIARMTNHSVVNLSKNVESVNLSSFLCYLKAAILNSKLSGVDDLVESISKLIEESHNKRISMEKVANALRATLNIDGF